MDNQLINIKKILVLSIRFLIEKNTFRSDPLFHQQMDPRIRIQINMKWIHSTGILLVGPLSTEFEGLRLKSSSMDAVL